MMTNVADYIVVDSATRLLRVSLTLKVINMQMATGELGYTRKINKDAFNGKSIRAHPDLPVFQI